MIEQVHIHPKVEKDIEQMKSLDNAPSIAAERAQTIVCDLLKGVRISQTGRLSLIKDARIKNLVKFNLGKGYRLVTIKEKTQLFIMFIGDHDQCDRWLDSYSRKNPHKTTVPMKIYAVVPAADEEKNRTDDYYESEDDIANPDKISQKALRKVFCGLISP